METIAILLIVGFFALIAAAILVVMDDNKKIKKRKNALETAISNLPNKDNLKIVFGNFYQYAFVLDNVDKVIHYLDDKHDQEIPFDKIISVEILEDNNVISSKSTTRTVGGALLGGAIAGGAGMVVGGLSGDSKQKKEVLSVLVKVKIRDYSTPSLSINCFDNTGLTGAYKDELQNAHKIADYVSVIIDEVDGNEKHSQIAMQRTPQETSVADELAKLASLKQQGILTDEEFRIQKVKLLNK